MKFKFFLCVMLFGSSQLINSMASEQEVTENPFAFFIAAVEEAQRAETERIAAETAEQTRRLIEKREKERIAEERIAAEKVQKSTLTLFINPSSSVYCPICMRGGPLDKECKATDSNDEKKDIMLAARKEVQEDLELGWNPEKVALSCGHIMDKVCLIKWVFDRNSICPLCRIDFLQNPILLTGSTDH